MKICILTFNKGEGGGIISLSNFISLFKEYMENIYIISTSDGNKTLKSDNIRCFIIKHEGKSTKFMKIFNTFLTQIVISFYLLRIMRKVETLLFIGELLVLPMMVAKIFRKKILLSLPASHMQMYKFAEDDTLHNELEILTKISLFLSNHILLYSPNLIKEWDLEKYKDKISIAHEHFLNFNKFKIKNKFDERENIIGYIGRLSEEKGTLNFVKAIPEIINKNDNLQFLIGGDGQLRDEIEKYINEKNLNDKVKLAGWISHDQLPDYMNKLKLVVLPSYTEGLPNIMLEAMACGTPVLATPVGAIPDVIKDGETGFIMEDNSPECIARNVIRALNHQNLEQIAVNACKLIEKEYTYEKAVEGYRKILEDL